VGLILTPTGRLRQSHYRSKPSSTPVNNYPEIARVALHIVIQTSIKQQQKQIRYGRHNNPDYLIEPDLFMAYRIQLGIDTAVKDGSLTGHPDWYYGRAIAELQALTQCENPRRCRVFFAFRCEVFHSV
jgi:hypothetical protein